MGDRPNVFVSPTGNLEIWETKPEGYFTELEYEIFIFNSLTIDEVRTNKLNELANIRYMQEISGVDINGIHIATDTNSQAKITGAALQAYVDPNYVCNNWKQSDGSFISITSEQILAIAAAVRAHVQSCFDKEAAKVALVHAATTKEEILTITWND